MSLKYREYEIRYNDPGVTVLRSVQNNKVVYRNEFSSLEDGLNYILERLVATESKDIHDAINTMKYVKNDLREACNKLGVITKSSEELKPINPQQIKKTDVVPMRRIIKK